MRRSLAVLLTALLLLPLTVLSAAADDVGGEDRSDEASETLRVRVRPDLAAVDETVTAFAKYGEDDDADGVESDDDDAADDDERESDDEERGQDIRKPQRDEERDPDTDDGDGENGDDRDRDDREHRGDRGHGGDRGHDDERGRDRDDAETRTATVDFTVEWGDGSAPESMTITSVNEDQEKAAAPHAYDAAGTYEVLVTATSESGAVETATATVQVGSGSRRVHGADRISTAARISQETFADGEADSVFLARADQFADALSAAAAAVDLGGPVLLTVPNSVHPKVAAEIERVLAEGGTVYVLGGEKALGSGVERDLDDAGYDHERISGSDRIETSVAVAELLLGGSTPEHVYLASAAAFPDALSAAAVAAAQGQPVLLTHPDQLAEPVRDLLTSFDPKPGITVVGGEQAVSESVVTELQSLGFEVVRISGADRFQTAAELAGRGEHEVVFLATGANFPDALAGAALAGRRGGPVLLVGDELGEPARQVIASGGTQAVIAFGGTAVVPDAVLRAAETAAG